MPDLLQRGGVGGGGATVTYILQAICREPSSVQNRRLVAERWDHHILVKPARIRTGNVFCYGE